MRGGKDNISTSVPPVDRNIILTDVGKIDEVAVLILLLQYDGVVVAFLPGCSLLRRIVFVLICNALEFSRVSTVYGLL